MNWRARLAATLHLPLRKKREVRENKMPRTALIAGATGLTGQQLLKQLLADARYAEVHALVRKHAFAPHTKLIEHVVDFAALPKLPKVDDVFCCLGTTIKVAGSKAAFRTVDFDYVLNIARAAKKSGAQRFIVMSSLGANAKSGVFYSRVKGEMEEALRELDLAELHIFQPSFLVGERAESRPGERFGITALQIISPLLFGPARKYRAIEVTDVARAMISAAWLQKAGAHVYLSDEIQKMADG
jgi:uncharacterized protein YbjT (DUF2867 family)